MHIGLIGGGNITETHARAARACGLQIAAVYGANREKVERLASEYRAAAYSDLQQFLGHPSMELVAIGSPSGLHAQQGVAAVRRGLHVLVEKPIDITTQSADELIAAANEARVKLGVFFQDRFKPDLVRLKEFLAAGRLGKLLLVDARVKWYRPAEYYRDSRWRGTPILDGGGALINQGIHTVDLVLWLAGDVAKVQARTRAALHAIETEDTALALLEFAGGALGVLQVTTCAYPGYARRLEITGSEGTLIVENDRVIAADLRSGNPFSTEPGPDDQNRRESSPVVSDVRGHAAAMADFIHAIETNNAPRCDGREGRRSLALVEAIYAAARAAT